MWTLAEVRAAVRRSAPSSAAWPDATLDGWIGQAIRFYSAEHPRRLRQTLTLESGVQEYPLPERHGAIVTVAYPLEGETRYLTRVARWSSIFRSGAPVYAHRPAAGGAAPEVDGDAGTIVFAQAVADGETAELLYLAEHPAPAIADDDAVVTVPEAHGEAITAFCDFAAHWELETDEALAVSSVSVVLSQLGEEARRAWNHYKDVMDRLSWTASSGAAAQWSGWGRIGL